VLTTQEIKTLRDDLRKAHELVRNAFTVTRAAGISSIARDLRHVGNSIEDAIADLCELASQLEKQTLPKSGGGDE
jgi:hypothetical protein